MNKKILLIVLALVVFGGVYFAIRSSQNDKAMDKKANGDMMMQKDEAITKGEEMELKMKEEATVPAQPSDAMMNEDGSMMMKH